MGVVSFLGEELAKIIDRKPIAANGIIRLAIVDDHGRDFGALNIEMIKKTIDSGLINRLEKAGIESPPEVAKKMKEYLIKHQSVITMMAI
jgi:hypothetical protein